MKNHLIFYSLIFLLFHTQSSSGQQVSYKNEFGFRSDNDAYLAMGKDRYYTNGLFIAYRRASDQSKLSGRLNKVVFEMKAAQKIYTPFSADIDVITEIDRPFAGYLYAGGSINLLYNSENSLKVSLQAGSIGPSAGGKEVQEFLHNSVGFYKISGWEWQIKNETAINTSLEYNHFLGRSASNKVDLAVNSYINAGNTFSGIGAGLTFRTGSINQLFHSVVNQSTVSNNAETELLSNKEYFFYLKPMIHYIAYDATVEGGIFREDKGPVTFDVKPLVFSQQIGLMYAKSRWAADFSVTLKSREIKSKASAHQYGSISLFYKFN